jgi:hypothetical protein
MRAKMRQGPRDAFCEGITTRGIPRRNQPDIPIFCISLVAHANPLSALEAKTRASDDTTSGSGAETERLGYLAVQRWVSDHRLASFFAIPCLHVTAGTKHVMKHGPSVHYLRSIPGEISIVLRGIKVGQDLGSI